MFDLPINIIILVQETIIDTSFVVAKGDRICKRKNATAEKFDGHHRS